jgi:hypothetical protein
MSMGVTDAIARPGIRSAAPTLEAPQDRLGHAVDVGAAVAQVLFDDRARHAVNDVRALRFGEDSPAAAATTPAASNTRDRTRRIEAPRERFGDALRSQFLNDPADELENRGRPQTAH